MSKYNPAVHNRHSIRTKGHDYSKPGFYFITICIKNRRFLLGNKYNCKLNPAGEMVSAEWLELTNRFKNIRLHEFVVMPNHFHALLEIVPATSGATLVVAPGVTVGLIIDAFKSITTVKYIHGVKTLGWPQFQNKFWQRNYHDRIIFQYTGIERVIAYIKNNVVNWKGK